MQNLEFTVHIPPELSKIIGMETKSFTQEEITKDPEIAVRYFSEAITKSVEMKSIFISDFFMDSSRLTRIDNLKHKDYCNENGILNFQKLFQCKIEYRFSEDTVLNLMKELGNSKKVRAQLKSFGAISLHIMNQTADSERVITFSNDMHPGAWKEKLNENYQPFNKDYFFKFPLFKFLHEQRVFIDLMHSDDYYDKAIFGGKNFRELEKIFLSLMNNANQLNYLFVGNKYSLETETILKRLKKTYGAKVKMSSKKVVKVNSQKYTVMELKKKISKNLFKDYSDGFLLDRQGRLFYRNLEGIIEADEKTSLKDLYEIPLDTETQRIMSFI